MPDEADWIKQGRMVDWNVNSNQFCDQKLPFSVLWNTEFLRILSKSLSLTGIWYGIWEHLGAGIYDSAKLRTQRNCNVLKCESYFLLTTDGDDCLLCSEQSPTLMVWWCNEAVSSRLEVVLECFGTHFQFWRGCQLHSKVLPLELLLIN